MSRVQVNIDELRKFSAFLHRYSKDLDQGMKRTGSELDRINDSWKDEVYNRFKEKYKHSSQVLFPLIKEMEEYSRHLQRLANNLEEGYLRRG